MSFRVTLIWHNYHHYMQHRVWLIYHLFDIVWTGEDIRKTKIDFDFFLI